MIKIKRLTIKEDVYDLTVEDNHNFFADGILVHNCAEISLIRNQFCNLCEINASDIESQEDFNNRSRAAAFIGTLQASYTDFHYLRPIWKRNTEREALIGIGMTGIASNEIFKYNIKEAAKIVKEENERVAAIIGINKAARCNTIKPSGCMDPNTIIKTSKGDLSLLQIFELNGYNTDWGSYDKNTFLSVNERILIKDFNNEWKEITQLYVNGREETYDIELEDGEIITCTPNHRFLIKNKGWIRADQLTTDDDIVSY